MPEPPQLDAAVTIADALAFPAVRDGVPQVLAGESELHRPIRWVHSGEFPDMPAVLKGGELLLTHGMSVGGREDRQRRFVGDLSRAGLAGLMIELGAGMERVPAPLVDEARRQRLPLIVLHRPIPWVEVTEAVHRAIVNRQGVLLERAQALHDRFAALVTAGAGVAEVLRALAESVVNPVLLAQEGEMLYAAPREHPHGELASAWESASRGLPHAPDTVSVPVAFGGDPEWGATAIVALDRPLDAFDRIALERAVPVLALALVRGHELDALAARDRGEFLDSLADPASPVDDRAAHRRAAAIGFDTRASWLLPVIADIAPGYGRLDERRWALVGRDIRRELRSRRTPAVVGTLERLGHLAMVIGLRAPEQRDAVLDPLAAALRAAVHRTREGATPVICAGRPSATWSEAGAALHDTIGALPAMRHAPAQAWHDVSGPDLRRLLWTLRGDGPLADFVERRLAPLRAHDERGRGELLHTLEVLCAHGGRKAQTARALHLERQSLYKRLARIEALLDADLDDEDTLLGLHLALRARHLLG